jgi:hypothetical protein
MGLAHRSKQAAAAINNAFIASTPAVEGAVLARLLPQSARGCGTQCSLHACVWFQGCAHLSSLLHSLLLGFLFKLGVSHLAALLLALAKASDKISAEQPTCTAASQPVSSSSSSSERQTC